MSSNQLVTAYKMLDAHLALHPAIASAGSYEAFESACTHWLGLLQILVNNVTYHKGLLENAPQTEEKQS